MYNSNLAEAIETAKNACPMTFENLDYLYRNSPDAYYNLLGFIRLEFERMKTKMLLSIDKADIYSYTELKHKLHSTLITIEYHELIAFLEETKSKLVSKDLRGSQNIKRELIELFDQFYFSLDGKLDMLSAEIVM